MTQQVPQASRPDALGDSLTEFAFLLIVASAILKISYKGTIQAEAKAAVATETAESEQLKRQVVEARMAAMQAQVEPHFLFNTLASIDHLIETDPARASQMQKNLIALLRASMPSMREAHPTAHNLGREMAVIRPYLEILKVRMEDRLQTDIAGARGAAVGRVPVDDDPVAGRERDQARPRAEGRGRHAHREAEIVHGKLAVTVADTGLGFGKAATAGTGTGLANIRERLKLLYGDRASMTVADNAPSGTVVTLTVPTRPRPQEGERRMSRLLKTLFAIAAIGVLLSIVGIAAIVLPPTTPLGQPTLDHRRRAREPVRPERLTCRRWR